MQKGEKMERERGYFFSGEKLEAEQNGSATSWVQSKTPTPSLLPRGQDSTEESERGDREEKSQASVSFSGLVPARLKAETAGSRERIG